MFTALAGAALVATLRSFTTDDRIGFLFGYAHRGDPDARGLVGWLADALPVACTADRRDSTDSLLPRMANAILWAIDHSDFRWGALLREFAPEVYGRPALAPTAALNVEMNDRGALLDFEDCRVASLELRSPRANPGLDFSVTKGLDGSLGLELNYEIQRYPAELAEAVIERFADSIAGAGKEVG